jgi:hypothetical protein
MRRSYNLGRGRAARSCLLIEPESGSFSIDRSAFFARPTEGCSSLHWEITMSVPSHSRWVVSSLAALLVLPSAGGAQPVGISGMRLSSSATDSRLSAVPVTAPTVTAPAVPPEGAGAETPSARFDVDPIPVSTSSEAPAQNSTQNESPATAETGPTSTAATAGIHAGSQRLSRQEMAARADDTHGGGFGTDGVLMIVGGAGFIAGLIIGGGGGTAIAIAGAVVALYGLYLYLR